MKKFKLIRLSIILSFLFVIVSINLTYAKTVKILKAESFKSNGVFIYNWYWLRSSGAYAEWEFRIPSTALAKDMYINFNPLVTNKLSGGSGFYTKVKLVVVDVKNSKKKKITMYLKNPFRPIFAGNSHGIGYHTYSHIKVPFEFYPNSYIKIKLYYRNVKKPYPARSANSSKAHIGVNKDCLFIGYLDM